MTGVTEMTRNDWMTRMTRDDQGGLGKTGMTRDDQGGLGKTGMTSDEWDDWDDWEDSG